VLIYTKSKEIKMGFVNVENYDGIKGYISDDKFKVINMNERPYLVYLGGTDTSGVIAYRITHEREETATATATKVTNPKLLKALKNEYRAELLEEMLDE
jgi:hypothetical protein